MGLVIAAGLLCGLRGEEIMKVDFGGLMKYLDPGRDHATCPHLIVALLTSEIVKELLEQLDSEW